MHWINGGPEFQCIEMKSTGLIDTPIKSENLLKNSYMTGWGGEMAIKPVLIVEDEPLITFRIMEILTRAGYDAICTVSSGGEAVEKIGMEPSPGLFLIDIGLFGKPNAIGTAKAIRERSDIPIVFFTAYENENGMAGIQDIPRSCIIPKPFEDSSILEAVQKMGQLA
jgi:DNA-binding NarL/FixJ family response regulator